MQIGRSPRRSTDLMRKPPPASWMPRSGIHVNRSFNHNPYATGDGNALSAAERQCGASKTNSRYSRKPKENGIE